jgi:hypothetical protein
MAGGGVDVARAIMGAVDPVALLTPYLRPGEVLLWSGRPDPRVWFTSADRFLIPFGILWTALAVFEGAGAVSTGGSSALFDIPFLAVGAYMVAGRFVYKRYRKERTAYGITGQRALIVVRPGTLSDLPVSGQPVTIRRSGDMQHASVIFGATAVRPSIFNFRQPTLNYANTGADFFARSNLPFAFYDVVQPDAMLAALDQAQSGLMTPG